jgi:hypothetical protein
MRYFSATLLALIVLSSFSSAYIFDSNTPFGQCFVKYCSGGDKACGDSWCNPIYSGCAIPCSSIYSYVGAPCETMCNFAAGKSDSCAQAYISSASSCFGGCWHATNTGSCADDCEEKARAGYDACSKKATTTTRAPTTTLPSSGCNNNGICENSRTENCQNCERDCGCDDLLCSPGTSGANSWGCFDPCLAVDHSYYDPSVDKCVCDQGYLVNDAGNGCISADRCPEHTTRSGDECSCVEGYLDCNKKFDDGCEQAIENDNFNCGGCGLQCPANSQCENMKCLCESGLMDCDQSSSNGCEADPQTDELNCGGCGKVCMDGGACVSGECKCPDGYVLDPKQNKCVFKCDNDGTCEAFLGESCKSCGDCACKGKDVCDQFSDFADKANGCSPPVAYIMVSPDLTSYEGWWLGFKIRSIRNFYVAAGYKIVYIDQSGAVGYSPKSRVQKGDIKYDKDQKVLDAGINRFLLGMSNPSTKAVAYFGHGGMPSIEYTAAQNLPNEVKKLRYKKDLASGMSKEEAKTESDDASSLGRLDYAYIHTCHSLDDTSLADALVKSGGTFWGKDGVLYATGSMTKYVKP